MSLSKESKGNKWNGYYESDGVSKSDPKHVDPKENRVDPDQNS